MKKLSILIVFVIANLLPSASISIKPDITKKLITIQSGNSILQDYFYDSNGNLSFEKHLIGYTKYNYNNLNQLISIDFYENPSLFSSDLSFINEYNLKNKPKILKVKEILDTSCRFSNVDAVINLINTFNSKTTVYFEYNDKGQLIKSTNHIGYEIYYYNKKNRISRIESYTNNEMTNSRVFKYDKRNNVIENKEYTVWKGVSKISTIHKFYFDKKRNPFCTFNLDNEPGINKNTNNIVKEKRIEFVNDRKGKSINKHTYNYNEFDFPIKKDGNIEYIYK